MSTKPSVNAVWASAGKKLKPDDGKIAQGWVKEVPPHEWFNWEMNRQGSFSAYVSELGVPEWDSATQYFANRSLTNVAGVLYKCVQDNTSKNPLTESLYWVLFGSASWKVVPSNYQAVPGDKISLNNRTTDQVVNLPANVQYGTEVQLHPYPFTQYAKRKLTVQAGSNSIMGLNESMTITEDNVMVSCKYLGKLYGWVVEKMGYSGKPNKRTVFTGQSYGVGINRIYDANIVEGAPLIMLVHGGGWDAGSKTDANLEGGNYTLFFPEKYGMSVAAINYTLATVGVPSYPVAVNDVIAAAEFFKATHGVTKIHIVGASAGANLAALAVISRPDLFTSFVGYYGAYDLTKTSEFNVDVQSRITKYTTNTTAASPTLQAGAFTIPAYLISGGSDTTVNVQQTLDFATALGVTPDIVVGEDHSFKLFGTFSDLSMPDYAKRAFAFMDKVGE
jgi:acetyl esterase/lipase